MELCMKDGIDIKGVYVCNPAIVYDINDMEGCF